MGSCCRVEMLDHWAIRARAPRAAPGIEPGTSRTLSENHATRPSSHVGMLESMRKSAMPASVGHLRGLHNQDAGVRWRCKLPASAAMHRMLGEDNRHDRRSNKDWAVLGIEPRTSRTLSENHATRPSSQSMALSRGHTNERRRARGALAGLLWELNPGPLAP